VVVTGGKVCIVVSVFCELFLLEGYWAEFLGFCVQVVVAGAVTLTLIMIV
jgi:hypothetical protein